MAEIVTVTQLAETAGISKRAIQQYAKNGMPKAGHGRYDLEVCLDWLDKHVSANKRERDSPLSLNEERTRLIRLQSDYQQKKNDAADGILMLVATHEQHLRGVFSAIKSGMLAWVGQAKSAHERAERQKQVDNLLNDSAQRIEGMLSNAAGGVELTPGKVRAARRMG